MQVPARLKSRGEQSDKRCLNQTPFLLTFFGPRVGKENMDTGKRTRSQHVLHDIDCIVLDQAQVGQLAGGNFLKQIADTWRVHFNSQIVVLWGCGGNTRCGFAHPATDFKDRRCNPAESSKQVTGRRLVTDAPSRHPISVMATLCLRDATLTQDVTANMSVRKLR
jgi:hypothetical protein